MENENTPQDETEQSGGLMSIPVDEMPTGWIENMMSLRNELASTINQFKGELDVGAVLSALMHLVADTLSEGIKPEYRLEAAASTAACLVKHITLKLEEQAKAETEIS